jgi:hypothetical protein
MPFPRRPGALETDARSSASRLEAAICEPACAARTADESQQGEILSSGCCRFAPLL